MTESSPTPMHSFDVNVEAVNYAILVATVAGTWPDMGVDNKLRTIENTTRSILEDVVNIRAIRLSILNKTFLYDPSLERAISLIRLAEDGLQKQKKTFDADNRPNE